MREKNRVENKYTKRFIEFLNFQMGNAEIGFSDPVPIITYIYVYICIYMYCLQIMTVLEI